MFKMAVGHSDDVEPATAIAAVVAQCRQALAGARPSAGLLFASFESFEPTLPAALREAFPGIRLVGATSAGESSSVGGFQEDSITLALFASDTVDISAGLGNGLRRDPVAACRAAAAEALAGTTREPRVCIVFAEVFAADPQLVLDTLRNALPPGVELIGGASSRTDLGPVVPTYQFCDERVAEDGVAVLLFSGPIASSVAIGTGWKAIGPQGTITAVRDNVIVGIDGRPALEFLSRYLDATGPASFGNPIAVHEDGADQPYLRVAVDSDREAGTVSVMGSLPVGARVQLTTAGTDEVLRGTASALARAAEAFPAGVHPAGALLFSCAVRKFVLGSRTGREAELAREALGPEVPFCGLYCRGEIGPIGKQAGSRFFNETFVALLLGT